MLRCHACAHISAHVSISLSGSFKLESPKSNYRYNVHHELIHLERFHMRSSISKRVIDLWRLQKIYVNSAKSLVGETIF